MQYWPVLLFPELTCLLQDASVLMQFWVINKAYNNISGFKMDPVAFLNN